MAYDEGLAQRIRELLRDERDDSSTVVERKMFGGLAFLLGGNMSVGVSGDRLMVRVGPAAYEEALALPCAAPMDFTGKPLRGFVYVDADGIAEDEDLAAWIGRGTAFAGSLPDK